MKIPRVGTLIIIVQSILLLIGLGFLGVVLFWNWGLKMEAKKYATTAGIVDATDCFQHGHIWRYEIEQFTADSDGSGPVPFDGDIEPAGKTDGQFQVYHYLVGRDFERGHLEISQTYVDAFNERMRLYISHPEWFDKDGNRIPLNKSTYQTNDQTTVSN
jgi:hypothetical protein